MIKRIILAALVGVLVSGSVTAGQGKLYACITEDVRSLSDDGKLIKNEDTVRLYTEMTFPRFTYDAATGVLRYGSEDTTPLKMEIMMRGSKVNDIVAFRTFRGTGSSGVNVFRIRVWKPEMPFLYLHTTEVLTGRCRPM